MSDRVFIRHLPLRTVIGVHTWEREIRQELALDLEMAMDNRAAAAGDKLDEALDYHAVATRLQELATASSFQLVESLAEAIVTVLEQEFGITELRLELSKPGALPGATDVGVRLIRP